ncbi:MAG: preprotein translocase subunit SecE [Actinomycetota bacterium]
MLRRAFGQVIGATPFRAVAQLVEQRSPKPQVAGSSPVRPANVDPSTSTINRKATTVTDNHTDAASHESRGERKKGVFGRIAQFLREVVLELRKVVTPTRKELINYTGVVLAFVAIVMALITGLDIVIGYVTGFVFGGGSWTGN